MYAINLERRKDRLESLLKRFPLNKQSLKIFPAIDGASIEIPTYFEKLSYGEVGCFLSHKSLWEMALNKLDSDYIVIFEDDVQFSKNFSEKMKEHLKTLKCLDFDSIFYIGGRFTEDYKMKNCVKVNENMVKYDYDTIWNNMDCDRTSHAYIISKKCCELLLNEFNKRKQIPNYVFPPIDHYMLIILRLNKKEIYHSYPLICYSELDSESDIVDNVSRKSECSDYDFWHFANAIR